MEPKSGSQLKKSSMESSEVLKRALERERAARKSAEKILEEKSIQLFLANEELREINQNLEEIARKRAAQIGRNERRWRYALEEAGDGMWEYNLQTQEVFFSPRFLTVLGYDAEEFNLTPNGWLTLVHPEDVESILRGFKQYAAREIKRYEVIYRIRSKDNTYRWMLDRSTLVSHSEDGRPLIVIGSNTDITLRKNAEEVVRQSEEKYRQIIANMNLGLLEVDTDGKVTFANQSFTQMSGYSDEDLIGKVAEEILMDDDNAELIKEKNRLREQGTSDAYEIQVHDKHGAVRWWLISGAPLYNDEGVQTGSIGIHLDISKQKKLEQDLRVAKQAAEESSRAKELFLASMSHEIRTPMNAILGLGKQLKKSPLNELQTTFIDSINTAASHLLVIINDILDFSKIEAGKLTLEKIGLNLPELLEKSAQFLELKAEEKGLTVLREFDPEIAPVLIGDPYRITQALMNLLSNAIKFTEQGSVTLSCSLIDTLEGIQNIRIEVSDTGMGMDESFLESIFEKFSQENESITRKYGGSGLGMAISKQLITMMDGTISVISKKSYGTTFTIVLPFQIGSEEDTIKRTEIKEDKNLLKGKKILLVEDNQMNRLVANTILDQYGASVTEAGNGQQAIDLLSQELVDIVLMDVQMPVMDGLTSTRFIRENLTRELPIIALTANALKGEMQKCLDAGMNDFLSKPFEEADLISILAKWLKIPVSFSEVTNETKADVLLYSLKKLEDIGQGNNDFIKKMLMMFVEDIPEAVKEIQDAWVDGNIETVRAIAHRIKPTIDNLSIDSLKEDIRKIESLASAGEKNEILDGLVKKLSDVIAQVTKNISEKEIPRL
ncbi:PAS domain S-box protein [Bacteroidota bacterium]